MQLHITSRTKLWIFHSVLITFLFTACNISTTEKDPGSDTTFVKDSIIKPDTAIIPASDNGLIISCDGVGGIALEDSYTDVERKAGKENMTLDSNYNEGEFAGTYNTLWKGSPKEMKIYWSDSSANKKVGSIEIENEKSVYRFSNGIKIGSTLEQLVKMNNNKPIRFYGFDWDYGGMILTEGKGIGDYKCFSGTLNYSGKSINAKFLGDGEKSSSMPGIPLQKIYLSSINISSPE